MVNVSIASQTLGHPCVKDVVDLNKAVKMMKNTADAKWCFRSFFEGVPSGMLCGQLLG